MSVKSYDAEKNLVLLAKAKGGNESAASTLISENLGLVKSIAVRFAGRGQDLDDLIQIGTIGMLKAIKGYDAAYGTAFSTYAVPLIIGEIRRFLRDDGMIKVSREIKKRSYLLMRAKEEYTALYQKEPSLSELCELTGMEREDAVTALEAASPTLSLQESVGGGESGDDALTLEHIVGTDNIDEVTEKIALREAVRRLDAEDQTIIYLRYFKGFTQSETAQRLGMTQVKISRREKRIMERLRKELCEKPPG